MKYIYPNVPNWLDPASVTQYDSRADWIAERKKNGWRCLAIRTSQGLELWTRRHTTIPDPLPITRGALMNLEPETMIDGELMEKRTKDIKDLFYAFDILFYKGAPLFSKPWKYRRKLLEQVMGKVPNVELSSPVSMGKSLLYKLAVDTGDEGIVMKQVDSLYLVDLRSSPVNPHWIKVKKPENCFIGKEKTNGQDSKPVVDSTEKRGGGILPAPVPQVSEQAKLFD